ncbi:MAG TPA: sterol desaturase family protein [Thermoanaerobaculia bacterium]|nr:sterol desaturase family protein [Thermoanaerobaculia bacterium]
MAAIAVVFIPLERLIPFHPGQRLFRKHLWLDLLHYFVGGIFIIIFVRLTYYGMPALGLTGSPITVKHLPGWAQFLIFEASWTFLGYWVHRFEHVWRPLWRLHSIHESNEELDWLSAFRLHPLEPALFQVVTIVPLWFFGMSLPVAIAYKIYSYVFSHIQHANVVFPLPRFLKYVFPSPEFHRWHHARVFDENGNRVRSFQNFSEYPIWDILFGTFHLPKERPTAYGNAQHMPMDYFAQLAYPFGLHEHALSIQKRVKRWFGIEALKERIGRALSPTHEAFENRISKLSLTKEAP